MMIKDRVGKDTTWPDLLGYFEDVSGQKLDWFWNQWVSNSTFPTLTVDDAEPIQIERSWRTRVTVKQSGTKNLFRMRYRVNVRRGPQLASKVVTTKAPSETFTVESDFQPTSVDVEIFPFTLARVVKEPKRARR
jgi:aminopeptidase N